MIPNLQMGWCKYSYGGVECADCKSGKCSRCGFNPHNRELHDRRVREAIAGWRRTGWKVVKDERRTYEEATL